MATKQVVRVSSPADRWRYVCPRGHRSWEPTNSHFWCQQCSQTWDVDPAFDELRDLKTGALIPRNRVELVEASG